MIEPTSFWGVLGQLIFSLTVSICIVTAIYGNYRLWHISQEMFIQKRFPSILFGLNASLIFHLLSTIPGFFTRIYSHQGSFYLTAGLIVNIVSIYLFLFFSITKSWMIFYKSKWILMTLRLKWQQHIASIDNTSSVHWVIRYNYCLGSLRFMYQIFGSYHVFIVIITVFGALCSYYQVFHQSFVVIILVFAFIVTVLIYIVILCKTERLALHDDIFYIHWEAKAHTKILCGYVVVFMINVILMDVIKDHILESFIFAPIYCVMFYAIHHISTYGILQKNGHYINNSAIVELSSSSPSPSSPPAKRITLKEVLSNNKSINLFMIHLSKEANMECLLSYIEITQYLQYIMDTNKIVKQSSATEKDVELPSEVPMSAILSKKYEAEDEENIIKLRGYALYNKYIREMSEFEINIGWNQREEATNIFEDKSLLLSNKAIRIKDVFQLFQSIQFEMYYLLSFSYSRFVTKPEYAQIDTAVFQN